MSFVKYSAAFLLGGALVGGAGVAYQGALMPFSHEASPAESAERQPLYWVAPMDANYRRDKPGKSPMGMDLIPFYGDDAPTAEVGTVTISPEVVNNLGVRQTSVNRGLLFNSVRTVGYLKYNEDTLVHIHSRVSGWVEKSFVKFEGEWVKKGDPLFDLYSPELVNAQEELVFALNRNDKRLVGAAREKLKALQVPASFIERLTRSRKVSQTVRFFATRDGAVEGLNLREGLYVTPGLTLLSIADLRELWLEADVFERQAHLVKVGQPVEVTTDYVPGLAIKSVVDFIYPSVDSKTRTVRVRVRVNNESMAMKPNMFTHIAIEANSAEQALLIPKEALIRGGKQNRVVLALGDGKYKSVAVNVGRYGDDTVEVLEGLVEGDSVVVSANFLLDSESSKTSDFKRMETPDMGSHSGDEATQEMEAPQSVWVDAVINSIDASQGKANLDHSEIVEWKWPQMTMDFVLAPWVDPEDLPLGKPVQVEIVKESSTQYVLSDVFDASEQ